MDVLVYLPLVMPLLAGLFARPVASRLPPRVVTWLLTGAAVALASASIAVLGLLALTAVIRIPLVAAFGDMSLQVIHSHDPASLLAAVIAGILLTAAAAAALRAGWRRARALTAAVQHGRCLPGTGQVVVVPDRAADAYAVPGLPGRIVVTAGMLDALTPAERVVLLEHERAHTTGHHYLFTAAAHLAAAANPLLRPLASAVSYSVERWADERAAAACGDRSLAARTIAKAALASAEARRQGPLHAAALGIGNAVLGIVHVTSSASRISAANRTDNANRADGANTIGNANRADNASATGNANRAQNANVAGMRRAGPVPQRVAALLIPPPRLRPLLVVAVAVLVLISGVSALEAARDLHALLELAQSPTASLPVPWAALLPECSRSVTLSKDKELR